MSYITSFQRDAQRLTTTPTFTDTAQRLIHAATDSDYGPGTGASEYTQGASFACSFQGKPVRDALGQTAVPMGDADLYCALGTVLDPGDRVIITHLYGEAVDTPQTYDITSGPLIEQNLIHAEISLVTDGSDEVED